MHLGLEERSEPEGQNGGQQHSIGFKATTHLDESLMERVWVEQKGGFGLYPGTLHHEVW